MTSAGWTAEGRVLFAGDPAGDAAGAAVVEAPALVLDEPLSFWGGVDATTGAIVDAHHPQRGASVTGRALVMPSGRGSSSSSSVLAECLGAGVGPAAILLGEADPILLIGALVAAELGGAGGVGAAACPVVVIADARLRIATGDRVRLDPQGMVEIRPAGPRPRTAQSLRRG